jgi:hypothetical protein
MPISPTPSSISNSRELLKNIFKRPFLSYLACLVLLLLACLGGAIKMQGAWNLHLEPDWELLSRLRQLRSLLSGEPRNGPDLALYLGDSVLYVHEQWPNNADPEWTLPSMVMKELQSLPGGNPPPLQWLPLYRIGMKPYDFLLCAHALVSQSSHFKAAIIPVNFRMLSPSHDGAEAWQNASLVRFAPLPLFLTHQRVQENGPGFSSYALGRLDEACGGIAGDPFRALAFACADGLRKILAPPVVPSSSLPQALRRNFLSPLSEGDPQVQALLELGHFLQSRGVTPFFYLSPMPVTQIRQACGQDEQALEDHVALVQGLIQRQAWSLADYHALCQDGFFDPRIEHLKIHAMRELAVRIAKDFAAMRAGEK